MLEKIKHFFSPPTSEETNQQIDQNLMEAEQSSPNHLTLEEAHIEGLREEMDFATAALNHFQQKKMEALRTGNNKQYQQADIAHDRWQQIHGNTYVQYAIKIAEHEKGRSQEFELEQ